jgi:DNA-binding transcriptional regulator YiaG
MSELWRTISTLPLKRAAREDGRALLRQAQELLASRFESAARRTDVTQLVERWQRGEETPADAARELLRLLAGAPA